MPDDPLAIAYSPTPSYHNGLFHSTRSPEEFDARLC